MSEPLLGVLNLPAGTPPGVGFTGSGLPTIFEEYVHGNDKADPHFGERDRGRRSWEGSPIFGSAGRALSGDAASGAAAHRTLWEALHAGIDRRLGCEPSDAHGGLPKGGVERFLPYSRD